MIICCLAPIVFIFVTSLGLGLGVVGWVILAAAIVCVAIHFFRMRRQHGNVNDPNNQTKKNKPEM